MIPRTFTTTKILSSNQSAYPFNDPLYTPSRWYFISPYSVPSVIISSCNTAVSYIMYSLAPVPSCNAVLHIFPHKMLHAATRIYHIPPLVAYIILPSSNPCVLPYLIPSLTPNNILSSPTCSSVMIHHVHLTEDPISYHLLYLV